MGCVRITYHPQHRIVNKNVVTLKNGSARIKTYTGNGSDYFTGGSQIQERTWNAGSYRFGFGGMEKDDEVKGSGNSIAFEARIYDSRLGRWLSVDPMFNHPKNISHSPYNIAVNSPIAIIDEEGELWWIAVGAVIGGGGNGNKISDRR